MTIKATFPDGSVMLFGDSYRRWFDQLAEYCHHYKLPRPRVVKCSAKWIGFGGLKWCSLENFPEELKEEGEGRTMDAFKEWKQLNQIEERTLNKHVRLGPQNDKSGGAANSGSTKP